MEDPFRVAFEREALDDLMMFPKAERLAVLETVQAKLGSHPTVFGKPLRHSLKGYRTLRIGDYRVGFTIRGTVVEVLGVVHRSHAYAIFVKRIQQHNS